MANFQNFGDLIRLWEYWLHINCHLASPKYFLLYKPIIGYLPSEYLSAVYSVENNNSN